MNVDNFGFNIARRYDTVEPQADLGVYKRFTEHLINEKTQPRLKFSLATVFSAKKHLVFKHVLKTYRQSAYIKPCFSGSLRVVMDERGCIYPCETLQYRRDGRKYLMGNLRDHDLNFVKLFCSAQAADTRKYIGGTGCACAHECDMETNILFNPKYIPELLYETAKIKVKNIMRPPL
jgi:hypothetical protein